MQISSYENALKFLPDNPNIPPKWFQSLYLPSSCHEYGPTSCL
jgi:hypothetical protein